MTSVRTLAHFTGRAHCCRVTPSLYLTGRAITFDIITAPKRLRIMS